MPQTSEPPECGGGRAFGVPRRREEIIALLKEAYTHNDLEQLELERRLELAEEARTIEELEALIADFPSPISAADARPTAMPNPAAAIDMDLEGQISALDGMVAPTRFTLLGDQHIAITPAEPRVLATACVIGDTKVDLRALSGMPGAFLLKVVKLFGDTKIVVSKGTQVHVRQFSLIGDQRRGRKGDGLLAKLAGMFGAASDQKSETPSLPGPTVVVTGFRLIGDTVIVED